MLNALQRLRPVGLTSTSLVCLMLLAPGAGQAAETVSAERESMYHKYLDIQSRVEGGYFVPHWMNGGEQFWYMDGGPVERQAVRVETSTGKREAIFDTARLRAALADFLGHQPPWQGIPFDTFSFIGETKIHFELEGRSLLLDLDAYTVTAAPKPSEREKDRLTPRITRQSYPENSGDVAEIRSPDGRWLLGENDHNLRLRSTYDGREVALTHNGSAGDAWYMAGDRANNVLSSALWSPDSFKLVGIKADTRSMAQVPIVHWLKPVEEVQWLPYAKAGGAMPETELYVIDILSQRQIKIDTGEAKSAFYALLNWSPDGKEVWFLRMNRAFKQLDIIAADASSGASRIVHSETQPTFIKGIASNPGWTGLFTALPQREQFLWISERDGWDHLYLYDNQGKLVKRLTEGAWPVLRVLDVDEDDGWVYFTAHGDQSRPYDTHIYRVGLDGRGFQQLTESAGQHYAVFSPSHQAFLDYHSDLDRPPVVDLRRSDGQLIDTVSRANVDALAELNWRPPEQFIAKAADQTTDLYGVMHFPYDFDATKKYPVIEYIYGGPQNSLIPKTFLDGGSVYIQALAQLGFITLVVDARGTPERGKRFQDVVYGNFGRNEIPDHAGVIRQLAAERPYIDPERVGIYGGSWGGYMTVRALLLAPEVYSAGVSIYPVVDHSDHWTLVEQYMGLPEDNPEGYAYGSSIRLADQLQGDLLFIHGTSDMNATFSATMKMAEALTRAGKPYDLLVFPEENHSFSPTASAYRSEAIKRYFVEHLMGKK